MEYQEAKNIAEYWVQALRPYCVRIEIAGSIRRRSAECGDIDIVLIPRLVNAAPEGQLFEEPRRISSMVKFIVENAHVEKGNPVVGKAVSLILFDGRHKLQLFFATTSNWGYILAIRTGSSTYAHQVLARSWSARGYEGVKGTLYDKNKRPVLVPEEKVLFDIIGVPYTEPHLRYVGSNQNTAPTQGVN